MIDVIELQVAQGRYGIPLERVTCALPRVRISPLPGTTPPLIGYFSYRGQPLPVIDLRLRFGEDPKPPSLTDHILVATSARRQIGLLVDRVRGLRSIDPAATAAPPKSAEAVAGVVALADGLLFVTDLDRMLSLEEERDLAEALSRLTEAGAA